MRKIVTASLLLAMLGVGGAILAGQAWAGQCQTNCTRTYNGGSTCNTWCF